MTKAERRKRARQRAREREQASTPPDAVERAMEAVEPAVASPSAESAGDAPTESEFITGPVTPRPAERRPPAPPPRQAPPTRRAQPELEEDEDDYDDDEGEDDDSEDPDLDDQEDALFNLACAAIEEGDRLTWQETTSVLMAAEVLDPRLALLIGLLLEGAPDEEDGPPHTPLPLTGQRVLSMLGELGLDELVEEAREVTSLSPGEQGESPDERELVRTNARQLNELAKRELAGGGRPATGRPLRSSDVRARRTSLATGVTAPRGRG